MQLRAATNRNPGLSLLVVMLLALGAALTLGWSTILKATGLSSASSRSRAPPSHDPPAPFRDVRVVALTESTPVESLAGKAGSGGRGRQGHPDVPPCSTGRSLKRLATFAPRVVRVSTLCSAIRSRTGRMPRSSTRAPTPPKRSLMTTPWSAASRLSGSAASRPSSVTPGSSRNAAGEPPLTRAVARDRAARLRRRLVHSAQGDAEHARRRRARGRARTPNRVRAGRPGCLGRSPRPLFHRPHGTPAGTHFPPPLGTRAPGPQGRGAADRGYDHRPHHRAFRPRG
jgi:hypothetical protein